jgi:hypothetical protein
MEGTSTDAAAVLKHTLQGAFSVGAVIASSDFPRAALTESAANEVVDVDDKSADLEGP